MFIATDFVYPDKTTKRYRLTCDICGADRGYGMKSRASMPCKKCAHAGKCYFDHNTADFKEKMSCAKKGQVSWCKGLKLSEEYRQRISLGKMAKSKNPRAREHRKLRLYISNSIAQKMQNRGYRKAYGAFRHLPYTVEQLREHLKRSFLPGMSWDNYGQWHVDHIVPDSWFTYSSVNDEGFKKSWALDNLQPLWAKDNLSNGNRYTGQSPKG